MKKDNPRKNKSYKKPKSEQIRVLTGTYQNSNNEHLVQIANKLWPISRINREVAQPIAPNTKVKVQINTSRGYKDPFVVVLKALGQELSLSEHVLKALKEAEVPKEFDEKVESEAKLFKDKVLAKDKANRLDLTDIALCTIDGETAKDFDDAVYARKKGKNIEVIVAIADVSHYVKEGSNLDEEAFLRGTSIYYPGACIPMLPESLSNGLCSLKPNVLRLALSVSFEVGPKGGISKPSINEAVIKSQARLTYNEVEKFHQNPSDLSLKNLSPELKESLSLLKKASFILRQSRKRRGAIDFDIIESLVSLNDQGEPLSIHPEERLESHRLIEDLMVATNELVAEFFFKKRIPSIYRVHEPPNQEKLERFFACAEAFQALGKSVKTKAQNINEPKDLQELMAHYEKSSYKETLNVLMLRAMMQARYSEQNLQHFGLASSAYLHFTSPIRRYADLIVHRQLRYVLFDKKPQNKIPKEKLQKIAQSISDKESKATELERKIDRLFAASFMTKKIGEVFEGIITACTEFGFFVRIIQYHVEGLVHIATISKQHVDFVPEKMCLVIKGSNERFMVGDTVSVKLINVNIERGFIDFELNREVLKKPSKKAKQASKKSRRRSLSKAKK